MERNPNEELLEALRKLHPVPVRPPWIGTEPHRVEAGVIGGWAVVEGELYYLPAYGYTSFDDYVKQNLGVVR